jgi:transmembrane sensor
MNRGISHAEHSRAIEALAADWIGRRDRGLSEAEAAEFAAWRGADPRHAEALERGELLWARLDRPLHLRMGVVVRRHLAEMAQSRRRRRVRLAASLVAVIGFGFTRWWHDVAPSPEAAAVGQIALLIPEHRVLADGSKVELQPGTEMAVDFSGSHRRVRLASGMAHFTVVHDPARPFIVDSGDVAVRAVGTAFTVQHGGGMVEVLVTEGRVAVEHGGSSAAPAPTPLAWVDAGFQTSVASSPASAPVAQPVVPLTPNEMEERQAWRRVRVEFSQTPLHEVVALMNRHNRMQFALGDSATERVRLSGIFCVDDPKTLVRLLVRGFGLAVERPAPEQVVLRRAP